MRIGHFIDISLLINLTEKAWIVSKEKPNYPIMVISKNAFKLYRSGIYSNQGNLINFNGNDFWLDDKTYNRLKVLTAKKRIDITKLAISLRPILDPELLASQPYSFDFTILDTIKNTPDDIYLISKDNPEGSLDVILDDFLEEVKALGLSIKGFYYINEYLNKYDEEYTTYKTQKVILQHAIGHRTDKEEITIDEIATYDKIMYYSNSYDTDKYPREVNYILDSLYRNSPDNVKRIIRDDFLYLKPTIVSNYYSSNKVNRVIQNKHRLTLNNIMTFESFKYNKKRNTF